MVDDECVCCIGFGLVVFGLPAAVVFSFFSFYSVLACVCVSFSLSICDRVCMSHVVGVPMWPFVAVGARSVSQSVSQLVLSCVAVGLNLIILMERRESECVW